MIKDCFFWDVRLIETHSNKSRDNNKTADANISKMTEINDENVTFEEINRFETLDEATKEELLQNRKALNTNRATKQWVSCLNAYLNERDLPDIDHVDLDELPTIIGDFYFSVRKKRISEDGLEDNATDQTKSKLKYYKNSSLKSGRAALNRHFKATFGIDIISNDKFIKANEIFQAITKQGKEEGRGETESKVPISDPDYKKLTAYFLQNMRGPPSPKRLQEFVLFNIIYYCGRRGRENLRQMNKDTFTIRKYHDEREYIVQIIKECDKNHREDDLNQSNEAWIYAIPDKKFSIIVRTLNKCYVKTSKVMHIYKRIVP